MGVLIMNSDGSWRKETKEEVMKNYIDLEGNKPCELCWEQARDVGILVIPTKCLIKNKVKRCSCGRYLSGG